ncbi:MAG: hypothetical protein MI784_03580 [Cytophagales bacterium]|nr:hypothetical protein [Cytophagales bacterium]
MKSKFLLLSLTAALLFALPAAAQSAKSYKYRTERISKKKGKLYFIWLGDSDRMVTFMMRKVSKKKDEKVRRIAIFCKKGEEQLVFSKLDIGKYYEVLIRAGDFVSALGGLEGVLIRKTK